jgi:hypothetical protein
MPEREAQAQTINDFQNLITAIVNRFSALSVMVNQMETPMNENCKEAL